MESCCWSNIFSDILSAGAILVALFVCYIQDWFKKRRQKNEYLTLGKTISSLIEQLLDNINNGIERDNGFKISIESILNNKLVKPKFENIPLSNFNRLNNYSSHDIYNTFRLYNLSSFSDFYSSLDQLSILFEKSYNSFQRLNVDYLRLKSNIDTSYVEFNQLIFSYINAPKDVNCFHYEVCSIVGEAIIKDVFKGVNNQRLIKEEYIQKINNCLESNIMILKPIERKLLARAKALLEAYNEIEYMNNHFCKELQNNLAEIEKEMGKLKKISDFLKNNPKPKP